MQGMSWLRTYQLFKTDSGSWSSTVSQCTKCDLWNNKTVFNIWQPQRPIFETGSQPNSNFKQANLFVPIFTYYIQSKIWIRYTKNDHIMPMCKIHTEVPKHMSWYLAHSNIRCFANTKLISPPIFFILLK